MKAIISTVRIADPRERSGYLEHIAAHKGKAAGTSGFCVGDTVEYRGRNYVVTDALASEPPEPDRLYLTSHNWLRIVGVAPSACRKIRSP